MQSSSLRTLTIVVTALLLGGLALVIWLVTQSSSSAPARLPTPTPRAIATAQTLTPTEQGAADPALARQTEGEQRAADRPQSASPPGAQPEAAGPREELPEGGFTFIPTDGYTLSLTATSATLTGPSRGDLLNPVFLISGGAPGQFVTGADEELPAMFDEFVTYFSEQDNFAAGPATPITVDGVAGLTVDIASRARDAGFAGRIVMAQPAADRLFVLVGVAPADQWASEIAADYEQLLQSIELPGATAANAAVPSPLTERPGAAEGASIAAAATDRPTALPTIRPTNTPFPATVALPTPLPALVTEPEPLILANANFTTQAAPAGDNVWAATQGGIVAWNRTNGGLAKFTALDGLNSNHFTAAVACPLPGLGMVFGGPAGLQIFDTRTGRWNSLNTGNSAMSFDDVATLLCDQENGYLVVGYAQHGLDIFDAATSEWTHLDRNNGLATDVVRHVAVTGDRAAFWVSSGIGVSVIRGDEALLYNAANSPLEVAPLHGLVASPAGVIWIAGSDRLYRVDEDPSGAGDNWTVYDAAAFGEDFPTAQLAGLAVTATGTVWLADAAGAICRFDTLAERCVDIYADEPGMASGPVTGVTADANGAVFYTTDGSGVSGFDGASWRRYEVAGEMLPGNAIRALSQDREGFLWAATENGVQQFSPTNPALARTYREGDDLPIIGVQAIAPATITGLWFGGENGAARFAEGEWRHFTEEDGLVNNAVQALTADRQRRIWIGTRSGLSIWNGESFFNLTSDNGLPSDNITALLAFQEGVWIGTSNGGLYEFAQNQLRVYTAAGAGLLSNTVTALAATDDGAILIGSERGLARFQDGAAQAVDEVPAVPIRSLAVAEDGRIWVGAEGRGIYAFDGTTWRQITMGLPSPAITALIFDVYGIPWAGGASGGLARIVE